MEDVPDLKDLERLYGNNSASPVQNAESHSVFANPVINHTSKTV